MNKEKYVKKNKKLYTLIDALKSLNSNLNFDESFLDFKKILMNELDVKKLGILSFNVMKGIFEPHSHMPSDFVESDYKRIFELLYENTMNFLNSSEDENSEQNFSFIFNYKDNKDEYSLYMLPLFIQEELTGMLVLSKLYLDEEIYFDDQKFLSALAGQVAIFLERTRLYNIIKEDKANMEFLYNISKETSISMDMNDIIKRSSEMIIKQFPINACAFLVLDNNDEFHFFVRSKNRLKIKQEKEILKDLRTNITPYIAAPLIPNLKTIKSEYFIDDCNVEMKIDTSSAWSCLMSFNNELSGIFGVYGEENRINMMNFEIQKIISTAAIQITAAIQNAVQFKKIKLLSITDPITRLYNHRYFLQSLDGELNRFVRYGTKFSLIMSDIDHFKNFNDTYGHKVGDEVLFKVAEILKEGAREIDIVARYGGEEFAIIMPQTDVAGAGKMAERIRKMVSSRKFKLAGKNLGVTISMGVAEIKPKMNVTNVIEAADKAMYSAKNNGRNVVYYIDHMNVPKKTNNRKLKT